jgi:quinol monooxygenase YgiN
MIVEYIRYTLKKHTPEQLIAAYGAAAPHLQAAPQCLGYELSVCEEEPTAFVLRIMWTSTRDHLEGFRKGPHFPPFFQAIRPFVDEIAEMRHYALSDLVWAR